MEASPVLLVYKGVNFQAVDEDGINHEIPFAPYLITGDFTTMGTCSDQPAIFFTIP